MRLLLKVTVLLGLAAAVGVVLIKVAYGVTFTEAVAIARHRAADAMT